MHCDYLNVTIPEGHSDSVRTELLSIVTTAGAIAVNRGLYRVATGGTFKHEEKRGFHFFGASGDMLASLRGLGALAPYLAAIGDVPHNVSLMHVAHDVHGSDSPTVLKHLVKKVRSADGIRLTRKKLNPQTQVMTVLSQGRDGRDTGTVYLGRRKSEVWAKVYDKQHERYQRASESVPPCTRYELSASGKSGASLRDVYEPDAIFWHFMSEVLPAPENAPAWVPGGAGFSLPPRVSYLPAEALKRLVEGSAQLEQMFELVDRIGPHGYARFLRLVNDCYKAHVSPTINRFLVEGATDSLEAERS